MSLTLISVPAVACLPAIPLLRTREREGARSLVVVALVLAFQEKIGLIISSR